MSHDAPGQLEARRTAAHVLALGSNIACPLCGDTDFDAVGLMLHLSRANWCPVASRASSYAEWGEFIAQCRAEVEK